MLSEGSGLDGAVGHRLERESDRVVVPMKLGNAGGGKDLTSGVLVEEGDGG